MTPEEARARINAIVLYLVEIGLAADQQFAFRRMRRGGVEEVTFDNAEDVGLSLKEMAYEDVYGHFRRSRVYNVRMLDGALVQMMYAFESDALMSHRLAFLPAVQSERFQRAPETYMGDEQFGHEVERVVVVALPIRFDYHSAEERHQPVVHPKSHLTLGDAPECRIPVSAAVSPRWFMDFILRNFYDSPGYRYADELPGDDSGFDRCIDPLELQVMHVVIPHRASDGAAGANGQPS